MLQVYHNNRCSKSRECVLSLKASETQYETIDYLENPLKFRQIKALLKKLKLNAIDIVRTNETEWAVYKGLELTNDDVIRILARHPILMQRPIVVNGDKAVVARPLEKISEIL